MYAAGKIPGSFFKREGRAGEKGTLTARMIDRPIRPLFPKGWHYETQLVAIPLSIDHVNPYDILAMNGASTALMLSPVPLPTPVGAVRIGKIDGNFVVNPDEADLVGIDLDLIVAGTDDAILMVEAGANEIPEAEILDALDIAHSEIKKICAVQRELRRAGRQGEARHRAARHRRGARAPDRREPRRRARRSHAGRGQARSPGGDQGGRGGRPGAVLRRPRRRHLRRVPPARAARVRQDREVGHPPAHRRPQEAPRRPRRARDPRHLDRGQRRSAHARIGALHPWPDAGRSASPRWAR